MCGGSRGQWVLPLAFKVLMGPGTDVPVDLSPRLLGEAPIFTDLSRAFWVSLPCVFTVRCSLMSCSCGRCAPSETVTRGDGEHHCLQKIPSTLPAKPCGKCWGGGLGCVSGGVEPGGGVRGKVCPLVDLVALPNTRPMGSVERPSPPRMASTAPAPRPEVWMLVCWVNWPFFHGHWSESACYAWRPIALLVSEALEFLAAALF